MSFFNPQKKKITGEIKGDMVAFNIKYYKSKAPQKYKSELLSKIIGNTPCLAVMNTKFMYSEQKNSFISGQQQLLNGLNSFEIRHRRIPIKRKEEMSIFGLPVKHGDVKLYQDYVIGLIVESNNIEAIEKVAAQYGLYYFIDCGTGSSDELLDRFEASFDDEEKLKTQFRYFIFDDKFMENMVVYCKTEDASSISSILD